MKNRRAVVLLSGGLDSYTAAAIAKADGYELYALTDYTEVDWTIALADSCQPCSSRQPVSGPCRIGQAALPICGEVLNLHGPFRRKIRPLRGHDDLRAFGCRSAPYRPMPAQPAFAANVSRQVASPAAHWRRDWGSTPAKVRKSVMRNDSFLLGSVGRQFGCTEK